MKLTIRQKDALGHIADHCRKAAELSAEISLEQVVADWRKRYLLLQCVQIVGEAAKRLGADFEAAYPFIAWRQIFGMRNRLVHEYDEVDSTVLWQTATEKLPTLLTQVENILAEHP